MIHEMQRARLKKHALGTGGLAETVKKSNLETLSSYQGVSSDVSRVWAAPTQNKNKERPTWTETALKLFQVFWGERRARPNEPKPSHFKPFGVSLSNFEQLVLGNASFHNILCKAGKGRMKRR